MRTKAYLFAAIFSVLLLGACGCENPKPEDEPTPSQDTTKVDPPTEKPDLSLIKQSVPVTDNWVWSGKPSITIHIENGNKMAVKVGTKVQIKTDKKVAVTTLTDSVEVPANGSKDFVVTTTENLEPGFYRAFCFVNGKTAKNFYFGIDPFDIVSEPDMQPDFVRRSILYANNDSKADSARTATTSIQSSGIMSMVITLS